MLCSGSALPGLDHPKTSRADRPFLLLDACCTHTRKGSWAVLSTWCLWHPKHISRTYPHNIRKFIMPVVCSGGRAADGVRGALRHDQLPGADDLLADCPWYLNLHLQILLHMLACLPVVICLLPWVRQSISQVCPSVLP